MSNGLPILPGKLKAILVLSAIVLIVLGSGLVFASHWMAMLYGASESASGTNASRTAGAAILALGLLAWTGTRQEISVVRAVVIPVLFTWFMLKSIVAYLALVGGIFKASVGRTVFAFDLLLAIIYGYFLFQSGDLESSYKRGKEEYLGRSSTMHK
jgi:hypothetical protein